MQELSSLDIEQVYGGASRRDERLLQQLQSTTADIRRLMLPTPSIGDLSTIRSHGYYQPPGMGYRVEYPGGFKPNGDAVSWRTRNNQTGDIISSGTNP